ncbi:unnamed protein product [Allacma fusca]|uniref:Uncharacterized protein n=1 Tax=Allacma fusca TaxID=39272 RepID=A0A8J2JGH0_9HEXA|nr:unnamed protein product [Allacma fusca]
MRSKLLPTQLNEPLAAGMSKTCWHFLYLAQLKRHSRWGRNRRGFQQQQEPVDTRTGHIRSHLRSPSGRQISLLDLRKHFVVSSPHSPTSPSFTFLTKRREHEHDVLVPLLT